MKRLRLKNYDWNDSVAISYVIAIFVGRKSYKTKKAQDLVGLVLFYTVSRGDFLFAVRKIIIRSD